MILHSPRPLGVTETSGRTLADFTSTSLIVAPLHGRTNREVIQDLARVLEVHEGILNPLMPSMAALNRELLTSQSLDCGMAVPQIRLASFPRARFAFGRTAQPLPWRAPTFAPIEFIILVASPREHDHKADELLSALATLAKDSTRLEQLRKASNADEIFGLLKEILVPSRG